MKTGEEEDEKQYDLGITEILRNDNDATLGSDMPATGICFPEVKVAG
ncbi:MAG TPA: hypothetical protein VJ187_00580 [Nitrospirota bacterium]|nr:hypothetical protein [Nitrospirota bacterium]